MNVSLLMFSSGHLSTSTKDALICGVHLCLSFRSKARYLWRQKAKFIIYVKNEHTPVKYEHHSDVYTQKQKER